MRSWLPWAVRYRYLKRWHTDKSHACNEKLTLSRYRLESISADRLVRTMTLSVLKLKVWPLYTWRIPPVTCTATASYSTVQIRSQISRTMARLHWVLVQSYLMAFSRCVLCGGCIIRSYICDRPRSRRRTWV